MSRRFRLYCSLLLAVVLAFGGVAGCGKGQGEKPAAAPSNSSAPAPSAAGSSGASASLAPYTQSKPLVIRLAHGDKNLDPYISNKQVVAVLFKSFVEQASGGAVQVQLFGGTLGSESQIVQQVQMGSTEMMVMSDGPITGLFPELQVVYIPYLFPNERVADMVFDGPFGQKMSEAIRKKAGLRVLAITENAGFRHLVNKKKVIRTPEDLQGLKIRTVESQAQMELIRLMGATPTPIPWSDTYTALQTGVVDGLNNNAQGILLGKLQEVQRYITLDGHTYSPGFLMASDAWFEKQPAAAKNLLLSAAAVARDGSRTIVRLAEATGYEKLQKDGMQVYALTPAEKDAFRAKAQEPFRQWLAGKVDKQWIDDVLQAVNQAQRDLDVYK